MRNSHTIHDVLHDLQEKCCEDILDYDHCVHMFDAKGLHIMTLHRCNDGGFDLALPDGKVIWADCNGNWHPFWKLLTDKFGKTKYDCKE